MSRSRGLRGRLQQRGRDAPDAIQTPPEPKSVVTGAERKASPRGIVKELFIEIVDNDRAGARLSSATSLLERHGYSPDEPIPRS